MRGSQLATAILSVGLFFGAITSCGADPDFDTPTEELERNEERRRRARPVLGPNGEDSSYEGYISALDSELDSARGRGTDQIWVRMNLSFDWDMGGSNRGNESINWLLRGLFERPGDLAIFRAEIVGTYKQEEDLYYFQSTRSTVPTARDPRVRMVLRLEGNQLVGTYTDYNAKRRAIRLRKIR